MHQGLSYDSLSHAKVTWPRQPPSTRAADMRRDILCCFKDPWDFRSSDLCSMSALGDETQPVGPNSQQQHCLLPVTVLVTVVGLLHQLQASFVSAAAAVAMKRGIPWSNGGMLHWRGWSRLP